MSERYYGCMTTTAGNSSFSSVFPFFLCDEIDVCIDMYVFLFSVLCIRIYIYTMFFPCTMRYLLRFSNYFFVCFLSQRQTTVDTITAQGCSTIVILYYNAILVSIKHVNQSINTSRMYIMHCRAQTRTCSPPLLLPLPLLGVGPAHFDTKLLDLEPPPPESHSSPPTAPTAALDLK